MYEPGSEMVPAAHDENMAVMRKRCCYYKHGRKVALTFDDGPNPPRTEQILAILREAGVHATFFVMGKSERFPDTLRRIVAEGHLVGNHGYSGERQLGDADEAEAVIGHITGPAVPLPAGALLQLCRLLQRRGAAPVHQLCRGRRRRRGELEIRVQWVAHYHRRRDCPQHPGIAQPWPGLDHRAPRWQRVVGSSKALAPSLAHHRCPAAHHCRPA